MTQGAAGNCELQPIASTPLVDRPNPPALDHVSLPEPCLAYLQESKDGCYSDRGTHTLSFSCSLHVQVDSMKTKFPRGQNWRAVPLR